MLSKNTTLKNSFLKNIVLVVSGTALAQLISILFTPILTRLYSPESFGVLGSFNAILSFILPLAALNYPASIVLAKDNFEKAVLVRLSLLIGMLTSSVFLIIILISKDGIINLLNIKLLSDVIIFIPVVMFFYVLSSISEQSTIRENKFKLYAKVSSLHSLLINTSKYILGLIIPTAKSLITITVIGYILRSLMLNVGLKNLSCRKQTSKRYKRSNIDLIAIKATAEKFKDFPLYRTPQVIINSISQNLPVLMLASYFGAASAGFFTLSRMVLAAPVALIGQSVSTVFYPKFHSAYDNGEDKFKLLLTANLSLFVIGSIPLIVIILLGPLLFTLIFGEEWRVAGDYARWLSVWILASLSAQPSVAAIPVLKLQAQYLIFEIVALIARFISLYLSYKLDYSAVETIKFFSLTNFSLDAILIIFVLNEANKSPNKK